MSQFYYEIRKSTTKDSQQRSRTTLTAKDINLLLEAKKLEECKHEIDAEVNAFTVLEERPSGFRRRPIFEPLINTKICDDDAAVQYPTYQHIRELLSRHRWVVLFDFASWFDQFQLDTEVRKFFTFRHKDRCLRLTTLPMGFRISCKIAQSYSNAILKSLEMSRTGVAYVDNILIASDNEEQASTHRNSFMTTCKEIGAIINEDEIQVSQCFSFLGEQYNLQDTNPTRCNTEKTLKKLTFLEQFLMTAKSVSLRQCFAIYGLLFFARRVLDISIAKYHDALRELASASRQFALHQSLASRINIQTSSEQLLDWTRRALRNEPVPIVQHQRSPNLTIYVDASANGWGAISIDDSGAIMTISRRWTHTQL
ncbi:hypothetical protein JST99_02620, partial [Candidatus Dependentiae bacterium]|nr:hypothetical protein [Candidatus Dependentiae bacterium]